MTDNLRGILAVLAASTAFVGHDATVKLVSAEMPASQIVILRGVIATAMLGAGVLALRAMRPLRILRTPLMPLRIAAAAGATVFIVLALRHLPLATNTTVLQATPLLVTAGAALFYGDAVGWRRWLAVLTGFLGVVLIVKPGGDFGAAAYLILAALACTTARDLSTRGLPKDIPSILIAAVSTGVATLSGFAILPFDGSWSVPTPWAWAVLTVCGACLFIATTFMTVGLRTGEIAVVAPFRYAPVPVSLLLGFWLWGDAPDGLAWLGIALVLGAGLYTLHRERASLRRAFAEPATQRSPAE
jgi:drug/metabolite transporter (DMT)-like permease